MEHEEAGTPKSPTLVRIGDRLWTSITLLGDYNRVTDNFASPLFLRLSLAFFRFSSKSSRLWALCRDPEPSPVAAVELQPSRSFGGSIDGGFEDDSQAQF